MSRSSEQQSQRFSELISAYAVHLDYRSLLWYKDFQKLLFEDGIDVNHKTV